MHDHRSVQPPTTVQSFDTLCEVQSDKASVEITSPFDGTIKELLVNEGEVAKVGEGLCVIEVEEGEESGEPEGMPESPPPHAEQEALKSAQFSPDSNAPTTPQPSSARSRRPHPLDPNIPPATKAARDGRSSGADVLATPSVRHFAKRSDVDLSLVAPGSGKGGRVEKKDVEAYLAGPPSSTASTAAAAKSQPNTGADVVVPLGRTRYGMWKAMVKVRAA